MPHQIIGISLNLFKGKFDIIVANILAEILLDLIPQMDELINFWSGKAGL